MMREQEKKRLLMIAVLIGFVCIAIVVLSAYAAELRVENNKLITENTALQGEIDTLNVKIKTANNIEHIESVATGKLGMVYPNEDECVYVSSKQATNSNLASTIKEQAYN